MRRRMKLCEDIAERSGVIEQIVNAIEMPDKQMMNTSGEAADQVIRMMLNGSEVLLKLTGSGAKNSSRRKRGEL